MLKPEFTTVAMVDDDSQNCAIVEDLLSDFKKIEFVGFSTNEENFKKLVEQKNPDVALLDIALAEENDGIGILKWLYQHHPEIKAIMVTVHAKYIRQCYSLGARGYVMKGRWNDLAPAINRVARGEMVVPPGTAPLLIKQVNKLEADYSLKERLGRMTRKEMEILELLITGKEKREIAELMHISFYTLKRHLQSMREKAETKSTPQLVEMFRNVRLD